MRSLPRALRERVETLAVTAAHCERIPRAERSGHPAPLPSRVCAVTLGDGSQRAFQKLAGEWKSIAIAHLLDLTTTR
jgi:hypothetical protein